MSAMPSPFPGMDPFLESQRWRGFHTRFIAAMADALTPGLRPRYVIDVEERVYLEHEPEEREAIIVPDVYVPGTGTPGQARGGGVATLPAEVVLPMPVEQTDKYLTIRDRLNLELVAVIEVLSPSNKRRSSDGRRE